MSPPRKLGSPYLNLVMTGRQTVSIKSRTSHIISGPEQATDPEIAKAFEAVKADATHGQPRTVGKAWQELETAGKVHYATNIASAEGIPPQSVTTGSTAEMTTAYHIPGEGRKPASGVVRPEGLGMRTDPTTGLVDLISIAEVTLQADWRAEGKYAKEHMRKQGQFAGYISAIQRRIAELRKQGKAATKVEIHVHYISDSPPDPATLELMTIELRKAGVPGVEVLWHHV
jgi:hypothetical protein